MTNVYIKRFAVLVGRRSIKTRPLKCNKCCKIINEIAYSESGDEEHIYCRKCWAMIKKEVKTE
jgi:late competence protein required for DNA uptake (superfamily II DNA/RNA helicase)